jgi:hypothetical protein
MATPEELAQFDQMIQQDADTVDAAHDPNGPYARQIAALLALSGQIETAGTITVIPAADYSKLIGVVEAASAMNVSQAELLPRIQALGSVAIAIARKIPGLLP